jgi:type II secretory pathway pseudopilin PulG
MEVIVAAGLVGTLFVVTIPLLSQLRTVRQEAARRMIAGEETANAMEAVAALVQRGELRRETLDSLLLTPAAERLPEALLSVELANADPPLDGQRVTVSVSWTTETGRSADPMVLTAWFPARGGE